jgi:hypothetical protein
MDKGLEISAKMITEAIKKAGGFMSCDDVDKTAENMYMPVICLAGWGSYHGHLHNICVLAAHAACDMGLLSDTGSGYKLN